MSTYVKYNGSWREPMSIYVNDGGTGKEVSVASQDVLNPGLGVESYPNVDYETPQLTTEDLRLNIDDTDTHEQTDGEVLLDSDGSTVGSSLGDTSNLTSIRVSSENLSTSTTYRYRARHKGSTYGGSNGDEIIDTTASELFSYSTDIGTSTNGGYVAGTIEYNGTEYAIIVSPKASGEGSSLEWSSDTNTEYGCADDTHDGVSNTDCMLSNDTTLSSGTATNFIDGIRTNGINGYNDGYIPAYVELNLMYNDMHDADLTGTDWDNDGESFENDNYWSSTEYSSSQAERYTFEFGSIGTYSKSNNYYVRSVRRIEL